ncbi:unnamed protein product [Haemonchus placei]|uniref:Protein kinase domain-containing protein n=1 Tax=Haemonchus placei TaxID=6290 RepID=A0A0N4WJW5_HAEPC|nr:unnamed protein product [Haemonchus placei]
MSTDTSSSCINQLVSGKVIDKYTVVKKIGEGNFGTVYHVNLSIQMCIKQEKLQLLRLELLVMQRLKARNAIHMPDLISKGNYENINYIVMKLLGRSLQDAKKTGPDKHLSLGPAIGVSIQDVKPGNFVIGRPEDGDLRKLYIIDFGMCRQFVDSKSTMLPPRKKAPFRGTPRYAPIASHLFKEHCRRDDVESW